MKKSFLHQILGITMTVSLIVSVAGCASSETPSGTSSDTSNTAGPITVSIGRQTLQNVTFPDGDTYEDNAYTRMAEQELNIDIVDTFEATGDDYDRQVSLALSAGDIPDMMKVGSLDELKELYENDLIADLTGVYEEYASDSFEGRAIENVTIDGKMVALPGTNVDTSPGIVWVRSDWMEQLAIQVDEDGDGCIKREELESIAIAFRDQNPENAENMVGIALAPYLTGGSPDDTYSLNAVAYSMGAYPKTWLEKDGEIMYGSTTEEMKQSLAIAAKWFQEGILDPQVGTRTWDDITALMANGQCGIAFGCWHIPDWLLSNVYALNNKATFNAYILEGEDGSVNCKHSNATTGYIVVSKKFEHPEIAIQIANLFYDELANSPELLEKYPEVANYVQNAVDGSSRPFNIEINSCTSLFDDYSELEKCLNGEITLEQVRTAEQRSNVPVIQGYLDGDSDVTGWSKYHSRLKGLELFQTLVENDRIDWLTPIYPETTPTMETNWANLEKLEEETFIKIVTGELDVESGFEQFTSDWKQQGGTQIIQEISEQLQ